MTFPERRALALALLNRGEGLTIKAAQFCGQTAVSPNDLTEKQEAWLLALAERAGLTGMLMEANNG